MLHLLWNRKTIFNLSKRLSAPLYSHLTKPRVSILSDFSIFSFGAVIQGETPSLLSSSWTIIFTFLTLAGLTFIIHHRIQSLKRKNQMLHEKVLDYTTKLETALVSIQSAEKQLNRQLYIYTRLVASISHDVKNPMQYLVAGAERTQKLIDKKAYNQAVETARSIELSARSMQQLLENSSAYIKTHFLGAPIPISPVHLDGLSQQKAAFFLPLIGEQQNELSVQLEQHTIVYSNEHLLSIILQNLLDNANKYTCRGMISLATQTTQNQMNLIIADSGPGLPNNLLEWMNAPVKAGLSTYPSPYPKGYDSLGLLIVKELCALLNITITARNQNGTRFQLTFHHTED